MGSITGFYTVLVEGDDTNDPLVDAVRSILDGHILLSRDIAAKNHYPAIHLLPSLSRVMRDVTTPEHQALAAKLREILAVYTEAEDLINIGAYVRGSSAKIDQAINCIDAMQGYLRQAVEEQVSFEASVQQLRNLFAKV
jgi:flagellum-specific ATP synthase